MSLKQAAKDALSIKCDVECFNALAKLRRECREKGLDSERVNRIIRAANHELHSKPEPKPNAGVPPEEPPTTQESQKEVQQPSEQVSKRTRRDIPPRARTGKVSPSGTTITGSYSGPSIIDMAEGRG